MKFDIYDLTCAALILPLATGITYQQQTAGICCMQREAAGVLITIAPHFLTDDLLRCATNDDVINDRCADAIDVSWLEWSHIFRMALDRSLLTESEEAWVHVNVVMPQYAGGAILTWENSD